MLKTIKQHTLRAARLSGAFALASRSRWRRGRLLILAYHGVSQEDEHLWSPQFFMTPGFLRERMKLLKRAGCNVLPLGEAVERLYAGDLPEKSVALTFDDGFHNFYSHAHPIIEEFGFPVTLYLTTYYTFYNRPVFDVICSYLLWKGRGRSVDGADFTGRHGPLDLASEAARFESGARIRAHAKSSRLSAEDKDALAATLAARVGVDYEAILATRLLHLLNPGETAELKARGADVQLHTHRHRAPLERRLFLREIEDNAHAIEELTGAKATHFCYPSGAYDLQFLPWLKEAGVSTATTCDPGFATRTSDPLLLPRLVDTSLLSPVEFEGWLAGVSSFLPRRPQRREEAG